MRTWRREPVACGVDIGTTNVKVVAIDRRGNVRGRVSRPTPRDASGLCIDADVLFREIEALIGSLCSDTLQVHVVCTVGIGEDGLLLDAGLRPLTTALAWFDPRRHGIARDLRSQLDDEEIFDAGSETARAMHGWAWARRQAGSERAQAWVAIADLPAVLWTGGTFISDTLASRTGAWRAANRAWDSNRVTVSLGDPDLLPRVMRSGDVVGPMTRSTLRETDLIADDATVVVGGHDHPIGGWAIDQMVPGAVLDSMGTAEVVVTQSPLAPAARGEHVDIAPGIRSHGITILKVVELARNVNWAAQDPAVAAGIRALLDGSAPPGPGLEEGHFLPARSVGSAPSYALDAPRDPMARASAVLGALACAGRESVELLSQVAPGSRPSRQAGGWTRSPGWLEIKAMINGFHTDVIAEPEVTAVGAALLAATARGWQPDPRVALGEASAIE